MPGAISSLLYSILFYMKAIHEPPGSLSSHTLIGGVQDCYMSGLFLSKHAPYLASQAYYLDKIMKSSLKNLIKNNGSSPI